MIRVNSSFILEELVNIVNGSIDRPDPDVRIKTPLHKEVLKFESTALVFWLLRGSDVFPKVWHKLLLDEIHHQYYERLRKHGHNFKLRQIVNDDFILRYKTYDKFTNNVDDFVEIRTIFAKFVSERSETDLDVAEVIIPIELIKQTTIKFKEFRKVIKL